MTQKGKRMRLCSIMNASEKKLNFYFAFKTAVAADYG